jgi:hypothetical protein
MTVLAEIALFVAICPPLVQAQTYPPPQAPVLGPDIVVPAPGQVPGHGPAGLPDFIGRPYPEGLPNFMGRPYPAAPEQPIFVPGADEYKVGKHYHPKPILNNHGMCCWSYHSLPTCASFPSEFRFFWGSCREFFGESCQPGPDMVPVPPGYRSFQYLPR